jgi:hypothetical protein
MSNCNFLMEIDFQLNPLKERKFKRHLDESQTMPPDIRGPSCTRTSTALTISFWFLSGQTSRIWKTMWTRTHMECSLTGWEHSEPFATVASWTCKAGRPSIGSRFVLRKRGLSRRRLEDPRSTLVVELDLSQAATVRHLDDRRPDSICGGTLEVSGIAEVVLYLGDSRKSLAIDVRTECWYGGLG